MTRLTLALSLLLVAPLFAGCMSDDAPPADAARVASSAAEAGAVAGEAPSAAKSPYLVQADTPGAQAVTAYPVPFPTNPPKTPYATEFEGAFQPYECLPTGGGLPLGGLGLARGGKRFDVGEAFAAGDVFSYVATLTFTNTEESWAELHLWHQFDDAGNYWSEPVSDARGEVVENFTGQGYIVNDEFFAGIGVDCWYGAVTSPIAFKISLAVTFAEGALPSAQPALLKVPPDATRLFATGVAVDPARPVTSHYRVFAPDDSLVCECALSSDATTSTIELPAGAGDYVVLVDHTENGFLSLALDARPEAPLKALSSRFEEFVLAASDGGPVDATLQVDLASTPLDVFAWVFAPGDVEGPPSAGAGHSVKVNVANARGEVLRMSMVGYATYHAAVPGVFITNDWYAVPIDGDWDFYQDHHAYDLGGHTVTVKAEQMRGEARMLARFYDRGS